MSALIIRQICGNDFESALNLWNETHEHDPITSRFFKRKVLLDVCFDKEGYFIAENENGLCGYIYIVRRLRALDNESFQPLDTAWINGYGVLKNAPQETAILLHKAAFEYAQKHAIHKIIATSYSPFYFTQGFDSKYETDYINQFIAAGYTIKDESYARDINLLSYTIPNDIKEARIHAENEGFSFLSLNNELMIPFWDYLNKFQSPGWRIRIRELLYDNDDYERIRVVTYNNEVIGFCVFGDPDGSPERFGPFGIRDDFRGRKLGQILLADCLCEMKKRGLHNAWMQWTENNNAAASVYTKAGFFISRKHITFEYNLGEKL